MYDTGIENLKKAALSVKVRSFLSGQDIDPSELVDNPELSLDLQSLIDDPNFEVGDGLFPDLMHEKLLQHSHPQSQSQTNPHQVNRALLDYNNGMRGLQQGGYSSQANNNNGRNPLAYMPQPVHGGSSFNPGGPHSPSSSPGSSPSQHDNPHVVSVVIGGPNGGGVKSEPGEGRLDFNANTVSSSSDPGYSSLSSYSSNNLTSPSSSSSSSSSSSISTGGGGGGGGGPGGSSSYNGSSGPSTTYNNTSSLLDHHPHHHHTPNGSSSHHHHHHNGLAMKSGPNGGLTFNPLKGLGSNGSSHLHGLSKKSKNVDKASDEYKRRRERNNVAVRKSREKAKMRSRETEERVKILAKENERLQKKIDLLTEELTFLRSFFSNVGGLPEQIHREFNKHLETFQHHHIQNGIQFPSFASFKSMQ